MSTSDDEKKAIRPRGGAKKRTGAKAGAKRGGGKAPSRGKAPGGGRKRGSTGAKTAPAAAPSPAPAPAPTPASTSAPASSPAATPERPPAPEPPEPPEPIVSSDPEEGWDAPDSPGWEHEAWAEGAVVEDDEVPTVDPFAEFFVGAEEMSSMRPVGLAAALVWDEDDDVSEEDLLDHDYLSFFLADEEYAVPITALREIVRPLPIAEVPRTPPYVLGVITLRGTVLPVLDLRVRLGLSLDEASRAARILVVETEDGPAGIWADRVAEVVRIGDEPLEPPPGALGSGADFLEGIIRREGRMLIVLNLARALEVEASGRRRSETEVGR